MDHGRAAGSRPGFVRQGRPVLRTGESRYPGRRRHYDRVVRFPRERRPRRDLFPGIGIERPSGEPPALPRRSGRSGRVWIGMVACIVGVFLFVAFGHQSGALIERFDVGRLVWISGLRTHWLTRVMLVLNGFGSSYTVRGLRWM